eukprot:15478431-Alexandrium_andersonii.AAC.1
MSGGAVGSGGLVPCGGGAVARRRICGKRPCQEVVASDARGPSAIPLVRRTCLRTGPGPPLDAALVATPARKRHGDDAADRDGLMEGHAQGALVPKRARRGVLGADGG